mmetsp:Transcript_17382/g.61145  ORF Transcript_17382/g.61145 Transcript_17382/m.61145 type:complete len:221 (-) Transcript_17382:488-1150(-)
MWSLAPTPPGHAARRCLAPPPARPRARLAPPQTAREPPHAHAAARHARRAGENAFSQHPHRRSCPRTRSRGCRCSQRPRGCGGSLLITAAATAAARTRRPSTTRPTPRRPATPGWLECTTPVHKVRAATSPHGGRASPSSASWRPPPARPPAAIRESPREQCVGSAHTAPRPPSRSAARVRHIMERTPRHAVDELRLAPADPPSRVGAFATCAACHEHRR